MNAGDFMNNLELQLFKIVFYYLFFLFIVTEVLGQRILETLRLKDTLQNRIKPRLFGIIWLFSNEIICILVFCLSIYGNVVTFTAFSAVVGFFHGLYMSKLLSTQLVFEKGSISYRTLFKIRTIRIDELQQVRRISPARSFGYSLEVHVRNGEIITLSEVHFKGINYLWDTFGEKQQLPGD